MLMKILLIIAIKVVKQEIMAVMREIPTWYCSSQYQSGTLPIVYSLILIVDRSIHMYKGIVVHDKQQKHSKCVNTRFGC